jgi:hypothetical protein
VQPVTQLLLLLLLLFLTLFCLHCMLHAAAAAAFLPPLSTSPCPPAAATLTQLHFCIHLKLPRLPCPLSTQLNPYSMESERICNSQDSAMAAKRVHNSACCGVL